MSIPKHEGIIPYCSKAFAIENDSPRITKRAINDFQRVPVTHRDNALSTRQLKCSDCEFNFTAATDGNTVERTYQNSDTCPTMRFSLSGNIYRSFK